jgi:protein-disulfide isomerase
MGELIAAVSKRDHVQGPAGASIELVEYADYECPYCGQANRVIQAVQSALGARLRFVFRNFPLAELHPHALSAARVAEAAALQGRFWPMHDLLFAHQDALDDGDLLRYATALDLDIDTLSDDLAEAARRVDEDLDSGERSGVRGTPTFFVNGQRFDGDWRDARELVAALEGSQPSPAA